MSVDESCAARVEIEERRSWAETAMGRDFDLPSTWYGRIPARLGGLGTQGWETKVLQYSQREPVSILRSGEDEHSRVDEMGALEGPSGLQTTSGQVGGRGGFPGRGWGDGVESEKIGLGWDGQS